jgi:hypothetical protein
MEAEDCVMARGITSGSVGMRGWMAVVVGMVDVAIVIF